MLQQLAKVGIVLVSSPARVHPSTELTWASLGSTSLIRGLEDAPISIVCDGYRTPADLSDEHAERVSWRVGVAHAEKVRATAELLLEDDEASLKRGGLYRLGPELIRSCRRRYLC